jgi:MscS family membrane protein
MVLITISAMPVRAAEPFNIFDVGEYSSRIAGGDLARFEWVVFNNGTSPLFVRPSASPESIPEIMISFEPSFVALDPAESATIAMVVTTEPNIDNANITFQVSFIATPMDDPNMISYENRTVNVIVDSALGNVGVNAIFGIWPNQLPPPLDGNLGAFLVTIVGWVIISLAFVFIIDPIVHYLTRRTKTKVDDIILRIIRVPVFIFILSYGTVTSLEILNIDRDLVALIESFYEFILVLLIVYVAYKVYKEVVIYYAKELAKKTNSEVDDVMIPILEKIGLVVIPLLGLITILSMFGFDLTGLLVGVGFLGLVIGLAAQSTLANFFAGLQLIADRPFKVGDLLRLEDGSNCEVRYIGIRATELYNPDTQEKVVIPNNEIANKHIINMAAPDLNLTLGIGVGVAYGTDTDKVMSILYESAAMHTNVVVTDTRKPVVRFSDFSDSSLLFKTFIPIDDVRNRFKVASDFRIEVNRRFAQEGIEIPFPQRVVTIKHDKD